MYGGAGEAKKRVGNDGGGAGKRGEDEDSDGGGSPGGELRLEDKRIEE